MKERFGDEMKDCDGIKCAPPCGDIEDCEFYSFGKCSVNQDEVNSSMIKYMLSSVGLNLNSHSTSLIDGKPVSYAITIPEKGNKEIIKNLIKMGWEKESRRKERTDNVQYNRCQYEGYMMMVTLRYNL